MVVARVPLTVLSGKTMHLPDQRSLETAARLTAAWHSGRCFAAVAWVVLTPGGHRGGPARRRRPVDGPRTCRGAGAGEQGRDLPARPSAGASSPTVTARQL